MTRTSPCAARRSPEAGAAAQTGLTLLADPIELGSDSTGRRYIAERQEPPKDSSLLGLVLTGCAPLVHFLMYGMCGWVAWFLRFTWPPCATTWT